MKITKGTRVQTPLGNGTLTGNREEHPRFLEWLRVEVSMDETPKYHTPNTPLWFWKHEISPIT